MRFLAVAAALVVPAGSATAQHPLVLERLTAWDGAAPAPEDEVIQSQVRQKAELVYAARDASRASPIAVEPATADRNAFNGVARGTMRNAWFVITRMPGCDEAPVRYMIMQDSGGGLKTICVNRGISNAWESLIGDTFPLARLAASTALQRAGADCSAQDATSLGVIRIASEGADLGPKTFGIRYAGGWTEIWPIETCGRTVEVTVEFTADGDGGANTRLPGDQVRVLP